MVQEAKRHEADDRKRKETADARNQGDTLAYQAEKALRDLGDKVPAGDRQKIEAKVAELREALKGEDAALIKRLTEEVQQASYALSQQMYAQQGGGPTAPPSGGTGGETPQGDVVEGEFREA
jgi:molecular chaperone DnaK